MAAGCYLRKIVGKDFSEILNRELDMSRTKAQQKRRGVQNPRGSSKFGNFEEQKGTEAEGPGLWGVGIGID